LVEKGLKDCGRCKNILPINEFNRDKYSKYGLRSQCKSCMKEERVKNAQQMKKYRQRECVKAAYRRYRRENYDPKKMAARNKARALERKPCEVCRSSTKIEAHHDDYDKQLEVRWLCAACHREWHVKHGEARNAA
jgi:hypothetical protein